MPAGLRLADRLPEPMFTPSTKAEEGHDLNISFDEAADLVGAEAAEGPRHLASPSTRRAAARAAGGRVRPGRHQVRARLHRRRAVASATRWSPRTRRGCGRPTRWCPAPPRRPSTSSRCATGPRQRLGQAPAAAGPAARGGGGDLGSGTSPPTSGSPDADWPTGTVRARDEVRGRASRSGCGRASPIPRAPPSSGRCRPSASTTSTDVRAAGRSASRSRPPTRPRPGAGPSELADRLLANPVIEEQPPRGGRSAAGRRRQLMAAAGRGGGLPRHQLRARRGGRRSSGLGGRGRAALARRRRPRRRRRRGPARRLRPRRLPAARAPSPASRR